MRAPTSRTPQVFATTRIVLIARAAKRLLPPTLVRRGRNSLAIQEETGQVAASVRPTKSGGRRAPLILLFAFVAVELTWVAVIGYLLYLAV